MRTMIVVASGSINDHAGEEYDAIVEVEDQPTTDTIAEWADRIRNTIRRLWKEEVGTDDNVNAVANPGVSVSLHAASPFNAMLINLQILMEKDEGIVVILPYLESTVRTTTDSETLGVIEKLDARGNTPETEED
jgi:hypothetical protein